LRFVDLVDIGGSLRRCFATGEASWAPLRSFKFGSVQSCTAVDESESREVSLSSVAQKRTHCMRVPSPSSQQFHVTNISLARENERK
jgi:hypothetical protein